jgi:hypothetical protein
MKWKIEEVGEKPIYLDPNMVTLELYNCRLHNQPTVAKRIFDGANKTVCAWVQCERVEFFKKKEANGEPIRYNPRITPHWVYQDKKADGQTFDLIVSKGRDLFNKIKGL